VWWFQVPFELPNQTDWRILPTRKNGYPHSNCSRWSVYQLHRLPASELPELSTSLLTVERVPQNLLLGCCETPLTVTQKSPTNDQMQAERDPDRWSASDHSVLAFHELAAR